MVAKKQHALKGRKFTPEQLAKRAATRLKNQMAQTGDPIDIAGKLSDLRVYLGQALKEWPPEKLPKSSVSGMSKAKLYVLLALSTLE